MLIVLQHNAAHLGIATGLCLSEAAVAHLRPLTARLLLGSAMLAAVATALAELLGGAIALGMLFHMPIWLGTLLTTGFVAWMLYSNSYRRLEKFIIGFVSLIGLSFIYELCLVKIPWGHAAACWFTPSMPHGSIPIIMSVLGAVVMPHNLFLHSEIIQSRQWNLEDKAVIKHQLRFEFADTLFSMQFAPDAVPNKPSYNTEALPFNIFLHGTRNIIQVVAGLSLINACGQGLPGHVQELGLGAVDRTDRDRGRCIAVKPLVDHAHVEADQVAFSQDALRGESMHDLLVDRAAQGERKAVHAEERRFDLKVGTALACQFLKDHGLDTGFDRCGQILEDHGHDAAGLVHRPYLKLVLEINAAHFLQGYCLPLILPFCMA